MLFPVEAPHLRRLIIDAILHIHLEDNVKSRRLLPDGSYERLRPEGDARALNSQESLLATWREGAIPDK
jgi:polyphosphate kinase